MGFPIAINRNSAHTATHRVLPVARWIAVAGGLGYAPLAPGTFGALLGVLIFVGFDRVARALAIGWPLVSVYLVGVAALAGLGIWAAGRAELDFAGHDDNRIVIDEVVGQMLALTPLLLGIPSSAPFIFWVVTGFVLFRVFDIWKPGPVRWAEVRFDGGLGVIADDLLAGVHAAAALYILQWLALQWLAAP